jgi:hypothetical protein
LPLIGGLPRRPRIALVIVSTALLLVLAAGEAMLLAFNASAHTAGSLALATWGAASAGFVVPLLLALLSPALEAFLATSQPVLASLLVVALSVTEVLLRLAGRTWLELGRLTHHLYDMLIFLPLAIEQAVAERRRAAEPQPLVVHKPEAPSSKIRTLRIGKAQPGAPE